MLGYILLHSGFETDGLRREIPELLCFFFVLSFFAYCYLLKGVLARFRIRPEHPILSLQLFASCHGDKGISAKRYGLRYVCNVVHNEVEDRHEKGALIAEKAGASDEARRKAVAGYFAALCLQSPRHFKSEENVAELGILIRLVRVEFAAINHLPVIARCQALQVAKSCFGPYIATWRRRVVDLRGRVKLVSTTK